MNKITNRKGEMKMVIDMNYWTRVIKRIIILIASILLIILSFKLACFYMPFLIAFIISLIIEPLIRKLMKHIKLSRKASSIIVFIISLGVIVGLLVWGITTLISEASNLLHSFNEYLDKGYILLQNIINNVDIDKFHISNDVIQTIQSSAYDFLNMLAQWLKNRVTGLMNIITSIPTIAVYTIITILALYFISTDKIYIIDQFEHHLPKSWAKKIGAHLREIIATLGNYLKAQVILIVVSFVICLIGLSIFKIVGLNVPFPLLVALGIGFVDALPILGSGTAMIPWAIISAIQGDLKLGVSLIVLWLIMTIVRELIEPKVVSGKIGIHPIFTLLAMYTGFKFIGVLGMLIGPIILIILKNIYSKLIDNGIFKTILDEE